MYPLLKAAATAGFGLLLAATVPAPSTTERPSAPTRAQEIRKAPEHPRSTVEVGGVPPAKRTVRVAPGGDLQTALDNATGGDLIVLEAGAVYQGPFLLRREDTTGWIVIASSAAGRTFPAPGQRVDPSHAGAMARLTAASGTVLQTEPGAHHYRLIGLEIAPPADTFVRDLVQLGSENTDASTLPHHLVIDRCYIHGDPARGGRRGVALNSRDTAIVDSYIADFKEVGADSQAIAGWNGAGPFRIANNYLEAAGENVMFGGADPTIAGLVPSDIEIVRNHLAKPVSWRVTGEAAQQKSWSVKNLFELKNARRVLVDSNLFEYNWPHGQNGFAILFTPRNQDGRAPWSTVEDVTFSNNLVRHVAAGINMLGRDDNFQSGRARRITIRNNVFQDVGGSWGNGRLFQLLDGVADVTIDHNTAFQTDSVVYGGDHAPHAGFVFQNNIVRHNERGIIATGTGTGLPTLTHYFPDAVVRRNVIVGGKAEQYPPDNFFSRSVEELGLRPDVELRAMVTRRHGREGTDGREIGADVAAIAKNIGIVAVPRVGARPCACPAGPCACPDVVVGRPRGAAPTMSVRLAAFVPDMSAAVVFWGSLFLLGYVYLGYALLMCIRARLHPRSVAKAPFEPTVSVVVAAYNEASRIAARLENLLSLDYPRDRLEIIVGSDGSTDRTVEIAQRFAPAVNVRAYRKRRGKPAMINALVGEAHGRIVVFADARQRFDRGALRALVANFADRGVGAVGGELMLVDRTGAATSQGAGFYWRYEKFIRSMESRAGSTVGATGAIYAIRRDLFLPIAEDTILDDVVIPLRVACQGFRVTFEPEARAYDVAARSAREELTRKARTIAGTFQLLAREPWLLSPFRNPLWFETLSHKALRLTIPLLHASLLAANMALADQWFYKTVLIGQVAFYAAALAGGLQRNARRRWIALSVPYAMCLQGCATVVGFARCITGRQQVTWDRAAAPQPAESHP